MTPLNDQQQQLIFDYAFGLTTQSDAAEAEKLLAAHPQAVRIHETLRDALSPLDSLPMEACPDDLAARTVSGLMASTRMGSGQDRLEQLLEDEQIDRPHLRIPFWRNWGDIAAVAAVLVLIVGVLFPTLGHTRQKYWQRRCQSQLANIHAGLASYVADHEGRLPRVPMATGSVAILSKIY